MVCPVTQCALILTWMLVIEIPQFHTFATYRFRYPPLGIDFMLGATLAGGQSCTHVIRQARVSLGHTCTGQAKPEKHSSTTTKTHLFTEAFSGTLGIELTHGIWLVLQIIDLGWCTKGEHYAHNKLVGMARPTQCSCTSLVFPSRKIDMTVPMH